MIRKIKIFITKIFNLLENCVEGSYARLDEEEYFKFCNNSGITMTQGRCKISRVHTNQTGILIRRVLSVDSLKGN